MFYDTHRPIQYNNKNARKRSDSINHVQAPF